VLEGSVRSTGGQLRVGARLVETERCHVLWTANFDHACGAKLVAQDEIADGITAQIIPELTKAAANRWIPPCAHIACADRSI